MLYFLLFLVLSQVLYCADVSPVKLKVEEERRNSLVDRVVSETSAIFSKGVRGGISFVFCNAISNDILFDDSKSKLKLKNRNSYVPNFKLSFVTNTTSMLNSIQSYTHIYTEQAASSSLSGIPNSAYIGKSIGSIAGSGIDQYDLESELNTALHSLDYNLAIAYDFMDSCSANLRFGVVGRIISKNLSMVSDNFKAAELNGLDTTISSTDYALGASMSAKISSYFRNMSLYVIPGIDLLYQISSNSRRYLSVKEVHKEVKMEPACTLQITSGLSYFMDSFSSNGIYGQLSCEYNFFGSLSKGYFSREELFDLGSFFYHGVL